MSENVESEYEERKLWHDRTREILRESQEDAAKATERSIELEGMRVRVDETRAIVHMMITLPWHRATTIRINAQGLIQEATFQEIPFAWMSSIASSVQVPPAQESEKVKT